MGSPKSLPKALLEVPERNQKMLQTIEDMVVDYYLQNIVTSNIEKDNCPKINSIHTQVKHRIQRVQMDTEGVTHCIE